MIGLVRRAWARLRPAPPSVDELDAAMRDVQQLFATVPALASLRAIGDPAADEPGTNRWARPSDAFPWVKTGPDRWVHLGGYAVRTDRQVAAFLPGTLRTHRPPAPR